MGRKQLRLDVGHLIAQARLRPLRRSERRQLRKRLGRSQRREWRSFGNVRGGVARDALNDQIVGRVRQLGHIAGAGTR